ncbi:MAG: DEAD/DEAH box helicase [Ktedonobacterales bacterium]
MVVTHAEDVHTLTDTALQRPLVLHAAWMLAPNLHDHRLGLWAEGSPVAGARPSHAAVPRHPFAASHAELTDALDLLWRLSRPSIRPRTTARNRMLALWLPTAEQRPLASPAAAALAVPDAPDAPLATMATETAVPAFATWATNALLLDAEAAHTLLIGLPAAATDAQQDAGGPALPLGDDLRFWAVAARFVLDLLARQRYLPGVVQFPRERYANGYNRRPEVAPFWWASLNQSGDRDRFDELAAVMPDMCRAARPLESAPFGSDNAYSPRVLLEDFAHMTINGQVQRWLAQERTALRLPTPANRRDHWDSSIYGYRYLGSIASRWLTGLAHPAQPIYCDAAESRALTEGTTKWHAGTSGLGSSGLRLCFRLSPPDVPEMPDAPDEPDGLSAHDRPNLAEQPPAATDAAPPALVVTAEGTAAAPEERADTTSEPPPDAPWRLDYLLQATDDPSLLVPLEALWRERGAVARFLDRRFDHPYQHALAGLGRAARSFAPIERSLLAARPTGTDLTLGEVYQFLHEALPQLTAAGFGAQVPSWLRRATARPAARLRLRSRQQTSSGLLGLDALVEYDWRIALDGEELTPAELERLAALKEPLVRLRGRWVEVQPEQMEAILRFAGRHRSGTMSLGEALRAGLAGEAGDEEGALAVETVQADEWIGELLGRLRGGETLAEVAPPKGLHGKLRRYQRRGLSWLSFLSQYGLGACLADDMGLGKSVELLSLLQHRKESGELNRPVLLVCPTSVAGNWRHESEHFTPDLRVLIHHGAGRTARRDPAAFAREAAAHDLVVTTYSLLPRDLETLSGVAWDAVVLDEAQNIKNADAKQSRAARKLHAPIRVALTGTPVENRLSELWSIMDFLNPGYLGSHQRFQETFATAIEQRRDPAATARLQALVRPFILRRLKTDPKVIRDLPKKIEMREHCALTREQVTLYEAVVRDGLRRIEAAESPMQRRGVVLGLLTRLKQVCNHPAHFLADDSRLIGRSGKLIRLEELIEELLSEGDRALIFTQFTGMGDRLHPYLTERFGVETLYLHGGVPRTARERMVERFQSAEGPPLFLLSLKAGGTGLNLTAANHVIHFDRWWNPAVENQATDRAFRIGQHRNVQVRKLVCSGTLEERIDELIERKRGLAEAVIGAGEAWLTEMSTAELRDLFTLRRDALAG